MMNGREIRNASSTARLLAMFRKEQLTDHHLLVIIEQAREFDSCLDEETQSRSTRDRTGVKVIA
jgi:hypothetical protein